MVPAIHQNTYFARIINDCAEFFREKGGVKWI